MWPNNCSIIRHCSKFIAGLTLVFVTLGCNTVPNDEVGKSALANKIAEFAEVVEFQKTDGQKMEVFGVKGYRMEFQAKVRITLGFKDLDERYKGGDPAGTMDLLNRYEQFLSKVGVSIGSTDKDLLPQAGTEYITQGQVLCSKSENGWTGQID